MQRYSSGTFMRRPKLQIRYEHEDDGRWIAEVPALPGVLAYGETKRDAGQKVLALTRRVEELS